jgi:hypothetical protein
MFLSMSEVKRASVAPVCQIVTRPPTRAVKIRAPRSKKMRARKLMYFHMVLTYTPLTLPIPIA